MQQLHYQPLETELGKNKLKIPALTELVGEKGNKVNKKIYRISDGAKLYGENISRKRIRKCVCGSNAKWALREAALMRGH